MMQPASGSQRPRPDMTQGARPDEPAEAPQLTRDHLKSMSPAEITAAHQAGQFADLLSGRQG